MSLLGRRAPNKSPPPPSRPCLGVRGTQCHLGGTATTPLELIHIAYNPQRRAMHDVERVYTVGFIDYIGACSVSLFHVC